MRLLALLPYFFSAAQSFASASAYSPWHSFAGLNAVPGCPSTCVDKPPFVCLGEFPGVNGSLECLAACVARPGCAQATVATDDGRCFTRSDGVWSLVAGGTVSWCDNRTVPGCAAAPPANGTRLTAALGAPAGARLHPLSPSVTLDGWNSSAFPRWGASSFLSLNLTDPSLLAMARAIAPAILRLGGSPEDSIFFDPDGSCVAGSGGRGPAPGGYFCSQVSPYVYGCLTAGRWEELLAFAAAAGLRLVLGVNACAGRMSNDSAMDFTNARALLLATAASPHARALYGLELSNEVVGVPGEAHTIGVAAYAADAAALRALAAQIFAAAGLPPPPLAGPDVASPATVAAVLAAAPRGTFAALTYHHYAHCPAGAFFFLLEPLCLQIVDQWGAMYAAIAAAHGGVAAWAGETAENGGGGVPGLTDSFTSTLYYAWQLGALPLAGVELSARQALVGGDYELINHHAADGALAPNPDYWLLFFFRALVGGGGRAYNVTLSQPAAATGARVFAFDAAPATGAKLALLALNLNAANTTLLVNLAGMGGPRTEFHLTGEPGVPHAPVRCNGAALAFSPPPARAPPDWRALGVPATGDLAIAAASVVLALI